MRRAFFLAAVALVPPAGASTKHTETTAVLSIADRKTLNAVIQFGPPDPKLGGWQTGEIYWRINVDLRRAALDRVELLGYAPVNLRLKDGRCFKIDMDSGGSELRSAHVSEGCSSQAPLSPPPQPLARPGMHYVGQAWDLSAWSDARGRTMLFLDREPRRAPLLTTTMRVLAVGGMGCPDCPATEVTLAGYVGNQLTLATVMLHYP